MCHPTFPVSHLVPHSICTEGGLAVEQLLVLCELGVELSANPDGDLDDDDREFENVAQVGGLQLLGPHGVLGHEHNVVGCNFVLHRFVISDY